MASVVFVMRHYHQIVYQDRRSKGAIQVEFDPLRFHVLKVWPTTHNKTSKTDITGPIWMNIYVINGRPVCRHRCLLNAS